MNFWKLRECKNTSALGVGVITMPLLKMALSYWSSSQLIYKRVRDEERIQAWGIGTRKKGMKIRPVPECPRIYGRLCREGLSWELSRVGVCCFQFLSSDYAVLNPNHLTPSFNLI